MRERQKERGKEQDGLVIGVNYSSAEPVKGKGNCQTPKTSLLGTVKTQMGLASELLSPV